ncbi:MAG: hypothetical protein J3R72DRAFT_47573 [Linnemannia gamsii]|nr:MAG: hypothetical protein J3R72DRAFT_47573 [Linnemannia gamsii]
MTLKRSSLALLLSVFVALIAHNLALHADAAPIDRLLALIPSSSTFHNNNNQQQLDDSTPLQLPPQPSLGRAQIRPIGQRQPYFPSDRSVGSSSSSRIPSDDDSSATVWYQLHQAQQRQQLHQQKMQSILSVRIQQQTQQQQQQQQTQQQQQPPQLPSNWSDRTLGGHAVLDDDDDDAGNELLDTESDGLLRPDADDEIEGTIEGEVLEEEEEDAGENEVYEFDDGDDENDSNDDAGDIYEPWLTKPPAPSPPSSRLTHREVTRRTRLARLIGENKESL